MCQLNVAFHEGICFQLSKIYENFQSDKTYLLVVQQFEMQNLTSSIFFFFLLFESLIRCYSHYILDITQHVMDITKYFTNCIYIAILTYDQWHMDTKQSSYKRFLINWYVIIREIIRVQLITVFVLNIHITSKINRNTNDI